MPEHGPDVATAATIPPGEVSIELPVYRPAGPVTVPSERWTYHFSWSGIPVGEVTISAGEDEAAAERRQAFVAIAGRTNALVDLVWRYRLDARGVVRLDPLAPVEFVSREQERATRKLTTIEFGPHHEIRSSRRKDDQLTEHRFVANNIYDMLSAVLLVLNLEYRVGDVYLFDTLTGTARYLATVTVAQHTTIDVRDRPEEAYRLRIETRELTDPNEEEKHRATDLWVSAAKPRRLLRARSKTFIGAVHGELVEISADGKARDPAP